MARRDPEARELMERLIAARPHLADEIRREFAAGYMQVQRARGRREAREAANRAREDAQRQAEIVKCWECHQDYPLDQFVGTRCLSCHGKQPNGPLSPAVPEEDGIEHGDAWEGD